MSHPVSHPLSQPLPQQPPPVAQSTQHPVFSGVHVYSHSGHLYFLDFNTLTLRIFAPLFTQLLQLLQPRPSHEVHEDFFLPQNGRQQSPDCQGKTTRGMQITFSSTSKQLFSASTTSASSLQQYLQLGQHADDEESQQVSDLEPSLQRSRAWLWLAVAAVTIAIATSALQMKEMFMVMPCVSGVWVPGAAVASHVAGIAVSIKYKRLGLEIDHVPHAKDREISIDTSKCWRWDLCFTSVLD